MPYVKDNEIIEIKNLNIPNGYCKIEGTVESFRIIVYMYYIIIIYITCIRRAKECYEH